MKRSTKKGFTIVELVIVIAIIAILAAVLIPTFASLIQKANESKDTQLVRNLNTALKTDGKEHKTMQDALDAAEAFGYDVGKINASATDNEILWDSVNDAFCYYNKDKGVEYLPQTELKGGEKPADYLLWKIYTSEEKVTEDVNVNKVYSIYWNSDAAYTKELKAGFDAGNSKADMTLKYVGGTGAQNVVIRTNGATALTVDADLDTIYHYGEAGSVNVIKCAMASYHVFGKVTLVVLNKGHVVAENGSNISQINIPENAASDIKVDVEANATVAAVTSDKEVGSDVVKIKNTGTVYVNKSTNEYVAFVGTTGYKTLKEAITAATSGQIVILMKDCTESTAFSTILASKDLTIDLNGSAMTFNGYNLDVDGGTRNTTESLTFIDSGAVKGKMICNGRIAVSMGPNDTLILDGVELECSNMYGLFPRGNAAKLEVKNSHITAPVYAIATNASTTANGGVSILIENSNIEVSASDQDNTAVQINVESNTIIRNSTLKGQRQALMIRAGVALIENTTIEKTGTKASNEYSDYSDETKTWGSGNMVPAYALVLGNRSDTAYQYATNVTLKGVTVKGGVYSWGNSTAGLETTIVFEGNNFGTHTKGENVKVTGEIKEN